MALEVLQPQAGDKVDEHAEAVDCNHAEDHCGMTRVVVEVGQRNTGLGPLVVDEEDRGPAGVEVGASGFVCRIRERAHRKVI